MATKGRGKTTLRGRDARTGEFIKVEEARRRRSTAIVERVPKPGYGDTGRGKKPNSSG